MSSDDLGEGFAPHHLVCMTTERTYSLGRFYDLAQCALALDHARRVFPEKSWGILSDGGLLDDAKIARPRRLPAQFDIATAQPPTIRKFRIVRRAA